MSYHTVFTSPDSEPADGPHLASTSGWWTWSNSVMARGEQFPESAHLAGFGWSDQFDALESELEEILRASADADMSGITAHLLAAVRARPEGAGAIMVTDGEPSEDDEDEDVSEGISESQYAMLSEADRSGLTRRQVRDKNGRLVWRWVRADTGTGSERQPGEHPGESAIARAFKDPKSLTAEEVKALKAHIASLPKERLRQLALAAEQRIGPTKAAIAQRLLASVKEQNKKTKAPAADTGDLKGKALRQKARELGFSDAFVNHRKPADIAARVKARLEAREKLTRAANDTGPINLTRIREVNDLANEAHEDYAEQSAAIVGYVRGVIDRNATSIEPVAVHGMTKPEGDRSIEMHGAPWHFSEATQSAVARSLVAAAQIGPPPPVLSAVTHRVVFTTQSSSHDEYWRRERNNSNLVSHATGGDGTICVYGGAALYPGTFDHESGHNLATAVFGGTTPSPDSEYGRAQRAEAGVTAYGRVSPAEDFAEAVAAYARPGDVHAYSKSDEAMNRGELRAWFPKKFAALEKIFNARSAP